MNDIEFTIQQGKLFMLQCRIGKRTAFAAIKIAVDMVEEKLITDKDALKRIEPDQLNQLLRPVFDLKEKESAVKGGRLAEGLRLARALPPAASSSMRRMQKRGRRRANSSSLHVSKRPPKISKGWMRRRES